ncbi:tyrosine-type recombinase/integrase [[Bacillus] enclensis]|uniref:tyrosine-type recombinase/integrase n=1 Tax=[Bacillus] enclensis TaxID=1402860 RepID=UPI0018DEBCEB|nr:site-specific integrase [[Bacillus] enclensis]MBH9965599.1 site-specific integrase [[Bacillus] enclensis]
MASVKTKGKGNKKRWVVRYDGAPDPRTGNRKQLQKTFKSSKEAEEFRSQVTLNRSYQGEMNQNGTSSKNDVEVEEILFFEYATKWLEVEYFQKVRPTTFKAGRYFMEKHICPFFGGKYLSDITTQDIKEFYAKLKRDGYAQKTISSIHKFLSSFFQATIENGVLTEHPIKAIKNKPKDPIRIAHPWSYAEVDQFLAVAEKEGKDVMYDFTLATGLRQGEVFALPWFNVDLDGKSVTVTRSVSYDEKGNPELLPKAPRSYRTLSLPTYLVEKLKMHKEKQDIMKQRIGKGYQHELDLVFPKMDGGFNNPSNVRRQLYNLMKKANVRRITFHELRHTHSSLLIRSGAQPKLVQERLGHEDIETTFRYYGHLWPNADHEAVRGLEKEMEKHKNQRNV